MSNQKKKRIILIGKTTSGKTTLCQYLSCQKLEYRKTQTVSLVDNLMIDTPGEFVEYHSKRGQLLVTSADADIIVFVQDATDKETMFPPAYGCSFMKDVVGIVTKSDLANEGQIEQARQFLILAGVNEIFVTSSFTGTGFEKLIQRFNWN